MVLIIDNNGSTASVTAAMVRSLGYEAAVVAYFTPPECVHINDYTAVILTSGPGSRHPDSLGYNLILKRSGIPLLGICQGMESIVTACGGCMVKAAPVLCEDTLSHTGEGLFNGINQRFRVVLRQSYIIDKKTLPRDFEPEAFSSSGAVQCVSIPSQKMYGTGFDPSNYRTEQGLKIFYNFLSLI